MELYRVHEAAMSKFGGGRMVTCAPLALESSPSVLGVALPEETTLPPDPVRDILASPDLVLSNGAFGNDLLFAGLVGEVLDDSLSLSLSGLLEALAAAVGCSSETCAKICPKVNMSLIHSRIIFNHTRVAEYLTELQECLVEKLVKTCHKS